LFRRPEQPGSGNPSNLGADREGVPFVNISGGFTVGTISKGTTAARKYFPVVGQFQQNIGRHDLKFGGDIRYQRFDQTLYFDISGQYFYFGGGTNDPDLEVTQPDGSTVQNLFPNYLLGLPDEYGQGSAQEELVRSKAVYLYAQDSWKLKPNVTLNYGLRWELTTPLADAGKKVQTFRPGRCRRFILARCPRKPAWTGLQHGGSDSGGVSRARRQRRA